ncbi:uncharacterized protein LOC127003139 [Eriocheir sinensis]|uniref:uncharacterized protein LOC127003139 n=1 Tax=Eriocheir sinensis TaxID=95602 RepID=UPI0021C7E7E2|nr:uncharacterized protein LOC127003139 [Eriocheir sinensis]
MYTRTLGSLPYTPNTLMAPPPVHRVSKKRPRSPDKGGTLRLVLEPPSVPARKRRLGSHPCLHVDDHNRVLGSVNGQECLVQLDSGSQVTVLFHTLAKRLGLITGTEPTEKQEIGLWIGSRMLDVIELKAVPLSLGGGVEMVVPATVFPAWLEDVYDADEVVLDAHHLRRGRMVQVFRPDGSDLFVCRPQQLRRRPRKTERSVEPDVLWVRQEGSEERARPMTVLLDTGAQGFHVSERRRKLLLASREGCRPPKRVVLDLGDGWRVNTAPLKEVASNDHDFIMGVSLLCKYGAVLDHARHTLAFKTGSRWREVSTQGPQQAVVSTQRFH